jgi:hypothetical protein
MSTYTNTLASQVFNDLTIFFLPFFFAVASTRRFLRKGSSMTVICEAFIQFEHLLR